MLIFNCTKAASDFFCHIKNGKKSTLVQKPPTPKIADDVSALMGDITPGHPPLELSQWLVHVDKVKRKTVVIAIHVETRYSLFFCNVKKGDVEGFVQYFKKRWQTNMLDYAMRSGLLELIEPISMESRFVALTDQFKLFQRGDRSVQGHANESLWMFMEEAYSRGGVPTTEEETANYDAWIGEMLRNVKALGDYIFPGEEMLIHFLKTFCEGGQAEFEQVRASRSAIRRNHWQLGDLS